LLINILLLTGKLGFYAGIQLFHYFFYFGIFLVLLIDDLNFLDNLFFKILEFLPLIWISS